MKGQFILIFTKNQDGKYVLTGMVNCKTFISWSNYLREAIDSLKTEGYHFNYIAEMYIISLAHNKRHMIYDFYLKQIMPVFEWKLNAMINKDKKVNNKFPRNWRHPIKTKFECYRV